MSFSHDKFNRATDPSPAALGTADTGETWTLRPWLPYDHSGGTISQSTSVLGVNGAGMAYSTDPNHGQLATIDHGSGDGKIAADLDISSLAETEGLGVVFRWQGATHFWTAMLYNVVGSGGDLYIAKQAGPTLADRTSYFVGYSPFASQIRLTVEMAGSSITATLDDFSVAPVSLSVTDSDFDTATEHGIHTYFTSWAGIDTYNPIRWLPGVGRVYVP